MYVQGVSTRKVKAITEELCGHSFRASAISAINKGLGEALARFADRHLDEPYPYLILDARYERVGLVLGSTQSLLRSMYSQIVPLERTGEYFGFHALKGRASSAFGPLLFGAVSAVTGNQRIAMMSLGVFLLAGAILLTKRQNQLTARY